MRPNAENCPSSAGDGASIRKNEVVAEFGRHLNDELDLMREAANASQLHRNFAGSPLLLVPEVYWELCSAEVMVMQRMRGTPVSHVDALRAQGVDIPKLARAGVEIFFTQVFRDGFFHADMHPGNIFVTPGGQYIALDFGIMGTLTPTDKSYLARNFLAFFRRDYKRVMDAYQAVYFGAPTSNKADASIAAVAVVAVALPRVAGSAGDDPQPKAYASLKDAMWTVNQRCTQWHRVPFGLTRSA